MNLTTNQHRAVTHLRGPCMVLAGPGSGKTFIIVRRIEYLIKKHKVRPEEILVVTFTKAAAKEMQERFLALMGTAGGTVVFGTFHSIFLEMLRRSMRLTQINIITEGQKRTLIEQLLIEKELPCDAQDIADVMKEVGVIKNQNGKPLERELESSLTMEQFKEVMHAYEEAKNREGKIDFEDILIQTYQLLHDNPKQLKLWQDRFQYILIDEFQDINSLQYETIKLLCQKNLNLFLVGDDDQSIYSFRGADPEIMLNFEKEYPKGVKVTLDKNFRSPTSIVRRSQRVIQHNEARFVKAMVAQQTTRSPITLCNFQNMVDESYYILKEIEKLSKAGVQLHQIAILVRSQKDVLVTIDTLTEYNIPYYMKEKHTSLYEHFVTKDILSYLNLAIGSKKREDFLRIANKPKRYLRRDSLEDEMISFEKLYQFYEDKQWMYPYIEALEEDIAFLKNKPPYAAIQYICKKIGYAEYLHEYAKERQIKEDAFFEILKRLKMRARKYKTIKEWLDQVEQSQIENNQTKEIRTEQEKVRQGQTKQKPIRKGEHKQEKETPEGKVQILTVHSSKGLEYEYVFLINVNEGTMPYKQAVLKKEIEEERRIFYVALTRSKTKLYISYVKEKNGKKVSPSRFVDELLN